MQNYLKKGQTVRVTDYRKGGKKTQNMEVHSCGYNQKEAVEKAASLRKSTKKKHRIKPGENGYCVLRGGALPKPKGKKAKSSTFKSKPGASKGKSCSTPMTRKIRGTEMKRSRGVYGSKAKAVIAQKRKQKEGKKTSVKPSNCAKGKYYVYAG